MTGAVRIQICNNKKVPDWQIWMKMLMIYLGYSAGAAAIGYKVGSPHQATHHRVVVFLHLIKTNNQNEIKYLHFLFSRLRGVV